MKPQKELKEPLRIIKRKLPGGDPTHDRTRQAILDNEIPRQLQKPKEPTKYDYLGNPRP